MNTLEQEDKDERLMSPRLRGQVSVLLTNIIRTGRRNPSALHYVILYLAEVSITDKDAHAMSLALCHLMRMEIERLHVCQKQRWSAELDGLIEEGEQLMFQDKGKRMQAAHNITIKLKEPGMMDWNEMNTAIASIEEAKRSYKGILLEYKETQQPLEPVGSG